VFVVRSKLWCIVLLWLACSAALASASTHALALASDANDRQVDVYCGPRCAQFILKYFDRLVDDDLFALIQEMQSADPTSGMSMRAIEIALNRRHIYTIAVRVRPENLSQCTWECPIVVHLQREGKTDAGLGHYIVWLPTSDNESAHLWLGLRGIKQVDYDSFTKTMSGVMLLTSDKPIDTTVVRSSLFSDGRYNCRWIVISLAVSLVLAMSCKLRYANNVAQQLVRRIGAMLRHIPASYAFFSNRVRP